MQPFTFDDERRLRQAIELAREEVQAGGIPFGALVCTDAGILGRGVNRVVADDDPTAHAEVTAIRDACRHLGSPSLGRATLVASAEPCALCLLAAASAGVSRIVYAADAECAAAFGFDYRAMYRMLSPVRHRPPHIAHQPIPQAEEPFRTWQLRRGTMTARRDDTSIPRTEVIR